MAMTLQQLRVLVAVVEHRSFTRGAQAVFMTQSAASQHLKALEGDLRTRLVERIGGEVVPTRAGEALVGYAREMLRVAADAERYVSALRDGGAGRLVLGASGSAVYLVPLLVAGFRAAYPGVEVRLEVLPRARLREAVAAGSVDVALLSADSEASATGQGADLVARALCPDRLVLAVSPVSTLLPAAALAPLPLERLAVEPLVAGADPSPSWRLVERWAGTHGVELQPALRLANVDAAKKAVEAGIGVAFLSAWVVEREVALGTLRLVPLNPPTPARRFELVLRRRRQPEPPLDAFLGFAPEYLATRLPAALQEHERQAGAAENGRPAPQPSQWEAAQLVVQTA